MQKVHKNVVLFSLCPLCLCGDSAKSVRLCSRYAAVTLFSTTYFEIPILLNKKRVLQKGKKSMNSEQSRGKGLTINILLTLVTLIFSFSILEVFSRFFLSEQVFLTYNYRKFVINGESYISLGSELFSCKEQHCYQQ